MAASRRSTIATRITLDGGAEVKSQLDAIGVTASRRLSAGTSASRGMSNALQNLSFQVNDVFTSLASGGDVMRVFAQQGGQIFQIFQQGGITVGGVTTAVRGMITPLRLAGGVAAAAAAGFGALVARAADAEDRTRQLGVVLKALGQTGLPQILRPGDQSQISRGVDKSAKDLEKAARGLRDVGLSADEAIKKFIDAFRLGIPSGRIEEITRIGENLKTALGDIDFAKAVKGGVEPLREIARQLKITGQNTTAAQDGLTTVDSLIRAIGEKVKGLNREALSPFGQAWLDVKVASADFFDSLSGSVTFALRGLEKLLTGYGDLKNVFGQIGEAFAFSSIPETINTVLETIKVRLSQTDPFGIAAAATRTVTAVQQLFETMGETAMATLVAAFSVNPFEALVGFAQSAVQTITGWLQGLANYAAQVGRAISSLGSAMGFSAPPEQHGASGNFASGGLIRGPGTGTSDSILARLSNGEFVVNALATRMNLPLLQAINAFRQPRIQNPRGFARGGVAGLAGSPGRGRSNSPGTVVLNLDSQRFEMSAATDVFDRLTKVARRKAVVSAGRKASHIGGRRYGG